MNYSKFSGAVLLLSASISGCSAQADPSSHSEGSDSSDEILADAAPADHIEIHGRTLMRRDLWTDADYERIVYEGRANQPSTSPEVLAAQLRTHTIANGTYYIEIEPNLELAKKILSEKGLEYGTSEQAPREARSVIGTDTRVFSSTNTTFPNTTVAFLETGCSGSRIGARTVYTAAHCVFDTETNNKWRCRDGTFSNGSNQCTPGWPSWSFGVNGTAEFAGPTANLCYTQSIQNAFVSLSAPSTTSEWWTFTRWDYAVVDLHQCAAGNTGWLGTWISGDATLTDNTFTLRGYPGRATCPGGANGNVGSQAPGGGVTGSDCPGTGNWPGSTWRYSGPVSKPFGGAQIWTSTSTSVTPGLSEAAGSIWTTIDVTQGNSGGGLYFVDSDNIRRVVGVSSNGNSTYNRFNRFTSEVANFFVAHSDYPDDTL